MASLKTYHPVIHVNDGKAPFKKAKFQASHFSILHGELLITGAATSGRRLYSQCKSWGFKSPSSLLMHRT